MDDRERELAEVTAELSETLESLRAELQEPPEGPLGLPRPPTPRELLRFTEQYTIPTTIALLEAAIREAITRKPKGHDFDYSRQKVDGQVSRHMSHTGG